MKTKSTVLCRLIIIFLLNLAYIVRDVLLLLLLLLQSGDTKLNLHRSFQQCYISLFVMDRR